MKDKKGPRPRESKRNNQKYHAQRRALERFGAMPNWRKMVKDIQEGRAKFHSRTSLRVTLWHVTVAEQPAIAVYDRKSKVIVTLLYPDEATLYELTMNGSE